MRCVVFHLVIMFLLFCTSGGGVGVGGHWPGVKFLIFFYISYLAIMFMLNA